MAVFKNNTTNPKMRNGKEILPIALRQRQILKILLRTQPRSSTDLAAALEVKVAFLHRFMGGIRDRYLKKERIDGVDMWSLSPAGTEAAKNGLPSCHAPTSHL